VVALAEDKIDGNDHSAVAVDDSVLEDQVEEEAALEVVDSLDADW
jgi:hypothetical protein